MKKTDPGLEHVRQVRHEISAELGHDPKRLVEHYETLQEEYSDRIVQPTTTVEAATETRDS
jgi:hypothetical protein